MTYSPIAGTTLSCQPATTRCGRHIAPRLKRSLIPDLTQDPRFDCNPFVTGRPGLRFYAGALLESREGLPLGTVCVLDYKARPNGLTERQTFTLKALARQVMAQLELRRVVAEKELLVEEAHHRVKNSLQMVQALLTLQARKTTNSEAASQLRDSAARVRSFGAMHEQLYLTGSAAEADLATYLQGLLAYQSAAAASTYEGRAITFTGAKAWWPTSDAPSVGLVLIELVTNALKYGKGLISVSLRQSARETVLTVEDEGTELQAGDPSSTSSGLGTRVMTGLLAGRGGRLEIDRSRGHTCFVAVLQTPRTGSSALDGSAQAASGAVKFESR